MAGEVGELKQISPVAPQRPVNMKQSEVDDIDGWAVCCRSCNSPIEHFIARDPRSRRSRYAEYSSVLCLAVP